MSPTTSPTTPDTNHRSGPQSLVGDLETDVVVVGAGLAGLTAAVTAARSGSQVALLDARGDIGGRARSEPGEGFTMNEGAHALYRAGAARSVLRDLGIRPQGKVPRQHRGAWLIEGAVVPWWRTSAVGGTASALRAARALMSERSAREAEGRSMADWMDDNIPDGARALAEMLVRTATYTADMTSLDAAATLAQVRLAARGVLYLHGGWQVMVDALRSAALSAGVDLRRGRVTTVVDGGQGVEVRTSEGAAVKARAAVLAAGGPAQATSMLGEASATVSRWSTQAAPVRGACLDLMVSRLASGGRRSAYGLGQPLYLVDHAATAQLAPPGGAVFHGLWYEPDLVADLDVIARLEDAMDLVQPGWRDHSVAVRRRKHMVVAHDRPRPEIAPSRRPTVEVEDLESVYVAGDWVGGHGMLADAAVGSGHRAGRAAAAVSSSARSTRGADRTSMQERLAP